MCVLGMNIRGKKGSGNIQRYKRKGHTKNEVKKVTKKTGKLVKLIRSGNKTGQGMMLTLTSSHCFS
jgi:hypothetical protein